MAILPERLMILPMLLYEQFIHHTQIHLCQKSAVFEYSAACLSVVSCYFRVWVPFSSLLHAGCFSGKIVNINYKSPITMYETEISIQPVNGLSTK